MICRGEDSEAALGALLAALASATAGLRRRLRAPSPRARRRDLRLSPVPWPASALRPAWPAVPWRGSAPSACRRMTAGIVEEQHLALDQALQRVRDDVQGSLQQARLGGDENEAAIFPRISRCWKTRVCWTPPTC